MPWPNQSILTSALSHFWIMKKLNTNIFGFTAILASLFLFLTTFTNAFASEADYREFLSDSEKTRMNFSFNGQEALPPFTRSKGSSALTVFPNSIEIYSVSDTIQNLQLQLSNVGGSALGWTLDPGATILLFSSGPVINRPQEGPKNTDLSLMESLTLGMNMFGFGANVDVGVRLANELILEQPAEINSIHFVGYQIGVGPTSPFTGLSLQLWEGPPNAGGKLIYGNMQTNVLESSSWTEAWRSSETGFDDLRALSDLIANPSIHESLDLVANTYWLDFAYSSEQPGPLFSPPIATFGQIAETGTALQYIPEELGEPESGWIEIRDWNGTEARQGLPIQVYGTLAVHLETLPCSPIETIPWLEAFDITGQIAAGSQSTLELSLDSTSLEPGTYVADLCIANSGAGSPVMSVEIMLNVTGDSVFEDRFESDIRE